MTLVSLRGSSVDLLHLLFGSILAVDNDAALFVSGVASLTLLCIALLYRGLVSEAFDSAAAGEPSAAPGPAARSVPGAAGAQSGRWIPVLGTLMAVGVMMLPAVAACCWARTLPGTLLLAALMGGFAPGWG